MVPLTAPTLTFFDLLFSNIRRLFTKDLAILGDSNVHNRDQLVHSSDPSVKEREAEQFILVNN